MGVKRARRATRKQRLKAQESCRRTLEKMEARLREALDESPNQRDEIRVSRDLIHERT